MKKGVMAVLATLVGAAAGAGVGIGAARNNAEKKIKEEKIYAKKHLQLYLLMNQWVKVKQENKSIAKYLEKNGYKEIAIYGMNYVGQTLLSELAGSDIKVKYGIDQNANNIYADIDILTPDEELEKVDAVIVTPIFFFDEIEEKLWEKMDCPIISMEDILYEI